MCIVIDTNTLGCVFDEQNREHHEFLPVRRWVTQGPGVVVFGGTAYVRELCKATNYLRIVLELKKAGRAVRIEDNAVDAQEEVIRESTSASKCDDPHVIALVGVSRCPVLCSRDKRSFSYVKDRTLYPVGSKPPGIYSGSRNARLLMKRDPSKLKHVV
jgi:hypothetical protein